MDFKQQYFSIWREVWDLHKKYHNIRADDEKAWERLDQECKQLDQQYKNKSEQKFAQSLLLGVVAELERSSKDAGETGTTTTTQP
ncbi:hypothetical protein DW740_00135 [Blautia obeum]|uniref:Uncharacterized protein n=1 Tax=Blautia obeum TaxID=40520 RepID=A0A414JB94_9FIRM|nr:hypothetical protein [Blautia obeum]RHE41766.1 hypothetical protein DW740_00135 [Blautia obeum]